MTWFTSSCDSLSLSFTFAITLTAPNSHSRAYVRAHTHTYTHAWHYGSWWCIIIPLWSEAFQLFFKDTIQTNIYRPFKPWLWSWTWTQQTRHCGLWWCISKLGFLTKGSVARKILWGKSHTLMYEPSLWPWPSRLQTIWHGRLPHDILAHNVA